MNIYRNTWAEVDLSAIRYNTKQLKSLLPNGSKIMGVVKADGYGHGGIETANVLIDAGVDFLMVALLEEALKLRAAGIAIPILVIGRVPSKHAPIAAENDITLSVFQKDWAKGVIKQRFEKPLSIHIELETGMNRTGVYSEAELHEIVSIINNTTDIQITGAYTHFAAADEDQSPLYDAQRERYVRMLAVLQTLCDEPLISHMGNSAAGIQYSCDMHAYTRFGISLYGMYPSKTIKNLGNVRLSQAMSLYSELSQIKLVRKGDVISYGGTYESKEDEWIGTVPIGYADGWKRGLQGFHVLVDGKKCPIVGRICMDSMMIKLDQAYEPGKRVTLIGTDNNACITMDDVAAHLDTICYEIPVMLTARIPRLHV